MSSRESFEGLDVYQEPAWLADLVVIAGGMIEEDNEVVGKVPGAIGGRECGGW